MAQNIAYINWYNKENYDRVTIIVPKGTKERMKAEAKRNGLSTNEFIMQFIPKNLIAERVYKGVGNDDYSRNRNPEG